MQARWSGYRESFSHATAVAQLFYGEVLYDGEPGGVAPGIAHVDNYDATFYVPNGNDKVVNLSWTDANDVGSTYDQAMLANNTVFVASAGDSGIPASPSTAYNVISVGASDAGASTATGPASDGAAKPDISAPGDATSLSAPLLCPAGRRWVRTGDDPAMVGSGGWGDGEGGLTSRVTHLGSSLGK